MRKTAFIFFLLFAFVQAAPAVTSLFSPSVSLFMVDEEKADDKSEADQKLKKDYTVYTDQLAGFSRKLNTAFHLAEKLLASPCMEQHIPPPNFS